MANNIGSIENLRVLMVEDSNEARALLRNMLSEIGIHQTFEASNGKEALLFMDNAFDFVDMIICDWNMPELSGVEFLRQIRSVDPSIPFLMVTGRNDMESVVEAKTSGVTGYIRKPYSAAELEVKLRVILKKMAA